MGLRRIVLTESEFTIGEGQSHVFPEDANATRLYRELTRMISDAYVPQVRSRMR
jgi:hypothetical protein